MTIPVVAITTVCSMTCVSHGWCVIQHPLPAQLHHTLSMQILLPFIVLMKDQEFVSAIVHLVG